MKFLKCQLFNKRQLNLNLNMLKNLMELIKISKLPIPQIVEFKNKSKLLFLYLWAFQGWARLHSYLSTYASSLK